MRLWLPLTLLIFPFLLAAQTDTASLLLPLEHLVDSNIQTRNEGLLKRKAISATRSLEDVENLPYTVWVITSEDILRNGFVTLGDVLRAAPGVRVSQPGNALEGETFLIRGLSGNQYMKVLINDVPVKPTVAPGMPIGAQLPIRQAERIEVLYGPAAAIYGDGACAGVVNIILKESERPIYTQADLSFGNFGYNSLDLMLGGKLFRDKNIFRFSIYGSSTIRERADYFYDDNLFMPKNYLPLGLDSSLYNNNSNYRAREPGDSVARTAPIPHESRLLGINLTWRGIHFNYNRMSRFDHSGLGLSPLAVFYGNPSNRIAEQIETFAVSFQKKRTKRTATNTISLIRYQVQNSSSFTPVFDRLSTALYAVKAPQIQSDAERRFFLEDVHRRFNSNERYFSATGVDVRYESRINATIKPNLYFDAGAQFNIGGGVPAMGYFSGPVEVRVLGETDPPNPQPFGVGSDGHFELNTFAQIHWRSKKMIVIGGTALNLLLENPVAFAPRLAVKYRPDSTWALRATYAEGFQRPSLFARAQSYLFDVQNTPMAQSVIADTTQVNSFSWLNQTERVRSAELGIRKIAGRFATDLNFFYQEAHRLVRNGYLQPTGEQNQWSYGYRNAPGLAMAVWGIQGTVGNDLLNIDVRKESLGEGEVKARLEYYFQYSRGREWFGYGIAGTRDVRNFPRRITQLRILLYAQKWEWMLYYNRQVTILGGGGVYQEPYERQIVTTSHPKFGTWDMMLRLYLSKNFLVYAHVRNIFDRHFAGIDATGTPDDLLYNPQPGRMLRFGVNYNMN